MGSLIKGEPIGWFPITGGWYLIVLENFILLGYSNMWKRATGNKRVPKVTPKRGIPVHKQATAPSDPEANYTGAAPTIASTPDPAPTMADAQTNRDGDEDPMPQVQPEPAATTKARRWPFMPPRKQVNG